MGETAGPSTAAVGPSVFGGRPAAYLVVQLVLLLFLLASGQAVGGRLFPESAVIVYFGYFLAPLVIDPAYKAELAKQSLLEYAGKFILGAMLTLVAFWGIMMIGLGLRPPQVSAEEVWPVVLFQTAVVTPIEELVFRGWLPWRLEAQGRGRAVIYSRITLASLASAALFAVFHLGAYGFDVEAFAELGILAVVWTAMSRWVVGEPFHDTPRPMGIAFSAGSHWAWNLCVLGILTAKALVGG